MSGQERFRNLWEHYYEDTQAIIWVIDSGDKYRMVVVKDELNSLLTNQCKIYIDWLRIKKFAAIKSKNIPILFVANKKDLPNALSPTEISSVLELEDMIERPWFIV
jgi:ADP-ribosylation factor-like protein 6